MSKQILKEEVRFAVHIPKTESRDDMHYVKKQITYTDGTIEPKTILVKDFNRPIWVTKPSFRNHKSKKEFEYRDKLLQQSCSQSDINKTIAGLIGQPYLVNKPTEIKNSPYVYGYDVTSTSLIKYKTLSKNEYVQSPYTISAFDIETNPETNEIIIATIVFGNKIYTTILNKFVANIANLNDRIKKAIDLYLPAYSDHDITIKVFNSEVGLISDIFKVANEWSPDFMSIWNMDFDIPKILDMLKVNNINPIDVICDTKVPRKYRVCRYKQGIKKRITASGTVKPVNPSLQWHSLLSTTSFYVIDAMCVYRQLRMAKQEEPSYSLDSILKKELNTQKLKFKEADEYSGLKWHLFMQANYPVEYIVYNMYDCLSMLELDAKIKDLTSALPSFAGITDFSRFNSNPKKIVDALFLFGLNKGRVIGTVSKPSNNLNVPDDDDINLSDSTDEEDDDLDPSKYNTLDLKGWIQLLPQNLLVHDGLKCLEEYPDVVTNIRGMVCDQDASSAYPSCTQVANVSKETCINELISVTGIKESTFREMNLSVCLGNANMVEYFTTMFDMPAFSELDID